MLVASTDLISEEKSIIAWFESHRPPNTTKTYRPYVRQYTIFCEKNNFVPSSPVTLASFMRATYERGVRGRSTLTSVIPSSVEHLFRFSPLSPSSAPIVSEMKRTLRNLSNPPKSKLPLLPSHLRRMARLVQPTFASLRDFVITLLMTFAMFREANAVALKSDLGGADQRPVLHLHLCRDFQDRPVQEWPHHCLG